MQTSRSWHASRASELSAGLAAFCTRSVRLTAANSTGTAAGRGIGGGSDKAALPIPVLATSTEPAASLTSFRTGSGVLNDAGGVAGRGIGGGSDKAALPLAISATETPSSIGALSMRGEPRLASPAATQPARATVPHNAANAASRRGFFTPTPSQVSPPSDGGFKVQSMTTTNSTGPRRVAQRG